MLRTPAAGVKGLNLNVIKQPHPTPDFQDVQRGKEYATGLHRGAINSLLLHFVDLVSRPFLMEGLPEMAWNHV